MMKSNLQNNDKKCITFIISGGVSCYKSLDVIRELVKTGYEIYPVLTLSACEFIKPGLVAALCGREPVVNLFDETKNINSIEHIDLAQKNDLVVVCPATANIIGNFANGICNDLATNVLCAAKSENVIICPAMNDIMWKNASVQSNVKKLSDYGVGFIMPKSGVLACNNVGVGKLADVDDIVAGIKNKLCIPQILKGKKILITGGSTIEKIDPVRYVSNFSSGIQGSELARVCYEYGAHVVFVHGVNSVVPNIDVQRIECIPVMSCDDMLDKCLNNIQDVDIFIASAAVSDWKPKFYNDKKIKKEDDKNILNIEFVKNKDILKTISNIDNRPEIVVGFALETNDAYHNALKKIENKDCDFVVLNEKNEQHNPFGNLKNKVHVLAKNGEVEYFDEDTKYNISKNIINLIHKKSRN